MLTHVHLLVHTLWCWHTLRRRWSLKGRERMGSKLGGIRRFSRKWSAYFLLRRWEFWRSRGRNTHRALASGAPDAESERPVQTVPGPARVRHRTLAWASGGARPVCGRFATLSAHGSGGHRTLPVLSVRWPCEFAELSAYESGVHRTRPVLTCSASGALQVWNPKFGFGN